MVDGQPAPSFTAVQRMIPSLLRVFKTSFDVSVVRDLQQAVFNLTDNYGSQAIEALLDGDVIAKLQRNSCHTDK